ncbi:UPF0481 protein At3g47200-like [Populus alba]|uniref:Uncharacterized protein n=1 Tax=Populus alba x Populus x berolinensis TaxID=444605 RepID=A0AAD6LJ50_9ROSI|nr:UPF0481 protein At3g47200-like [Populus alba]KAJ6967954.1 hypothetical protein NC653_036019 [Populus alba x Populus x berolinensis]
MSEIVNSSASPRCDDQWLIKIKNARTEETSGDKGTNFPRVPPTFRDIQQNSDCYDPSVVSIGPYHHGKAKLKEMEKLKETYARQFALDSTKEIDEIYREVEAELHIAKNRYPEDARRNFNDEQLAKMIFLDGCFILQFLFCLYMKPANLKMSSHNAALVKKDLFLLENQLPFEVLTKLASFRDPDQKTWMKFLTALCDQVRALPGGTELKEKITKFFRELQKTLTTRNPEAPHQPAAAHLLELLHKRFCFGTIVPENSENSSCNNNSQMNWYRYYPAEELRNIGIHFKPSKTDLFTDVQFKRGWLITRSLYIPPLRIDNSTRSLLLNLVAYETCHGASNESRVTSYVCFMDSLIDTHRDVQVLRSKGILLNTLGSDEQAAELFNQIASHLIPDPYAYIQVKSSIEKEHRKVLKKWVAMWLRVYFKSPWTFIAFVAATFTIILTAIQTFIALFPHKDQR